MSTLVENNTGRTTEAQGPGTTILEQIARCGAQQMLAQAMEATFTMHSEPTAVQQRCFELLGVTPQM